MTSDKLVVDAICRAKRMPEFGANAWLTFYLFARPEKLDSIASELSEIGGRNLEGSEGGFLYAKLPTKLEVTDVIRRVQEVRSLAEKCEVNVDLIDLDAAPDVERSKFINIFTPAH